jgi:hypothetical protein
VRGWKQKLLIIMFTAIKFFQFYTEEHFFKSYVILQVAPCVWATIIVPCHPVDVFSPVWELLGFTSNSTKPGIMWMGLGIMNMGNSVPYSLYLSRKLSQEYLYWFLQGWLDFLWLQEHSCFKWLPSERTQQNNTIYWIVLCCLIDKFRSPS